MGIGVVQIVIVSCVCPDGKVLNPLADLLEKCWRFVEKLLEKCWKIDFLPVANMLERCQHVGNRLFTLFKRLQKSRL